MITENALVITPNGIAMVQVEMPAPPRLEIYNPGTQGLSSDNETQLFPPTPVHVGYIVRGAGQDRWPIYEQPCTR